MNSRTGNKSLHSTSQNTHSPSSFLNSHLLHHETPTKRPRAVPVASSKPSRRVIRAPNIGVSTSSPRSSSPVAPSSPNKPSSVAGRNSAQARIPLLRHPSRLQSRDLTPNTFRIYIKHFMDRVFDIGPHQPTGAHHEHGADAFTLSYLRRVPELAELARRVARHTRKRKAHEEKEKSRASSSSRRATRPSRVDTKATDTKMAKRLFVMAIRAMYDEGSIVFSFGNGNQRWDVGRGRSGMASRLGGRDLESATGR